ncbi:MAG TPA: single-stranded-DNA-specific exonuclease RecJ [Gemmatimonadaceae bacterium]|nr:single-stranded-DNA-specific exonuclease RecJ [Gemmatimonadaceae bacterium]
MTLSTTTAGPASWVRPASRWIFSQAADADVVRVLEREVKLPGRVCALLAGRGFLLPDDAKNYLRPRLHHLVDPSRLTDVDVAVARIERAIDAGERILVHGDYDVDGMCSTTIVTRTLQALGATVFPFIPHRLRDGYDLTSAGVHAALEHGATLVITCDCGTSASQPVAELAAAGIDTIICDHHLPGGPLPNAVAVLNPRAPHCQYPDKDLCAAGVVFKLVQALLRARGKGDTFALKMLDLVALATVADVAPLRGENRILVRYGLRLLQETSNVGLQALIRAVGLEGREITAGRVGFVLAPRLNAAGRVGHGMRGVELLLERDEQTALVIARELEELNRERQAIDRQTLEEARQMAEQLDLDSTYGVVLTSPSWHPGVIGIVASRLVELLTRPVILIATESGVGKGSGRSTSRFDLHGGILACRELLQRFGGHRVAAGLTIAEDRIEAFSAAFNAVARGRLTPDDLIPEQRIDLEVACDDTLWKLENAVRHFEPFGMGNPAPTFVSRGMTLLNAPRTVGTDGIKLSLRGEQGSLEAIGWGMADLAASLVPGATLDVAYRLERDEFQGEERVVARLCAVRA